MTSPEAHPDKFYVIVRSNMPPGLQMAQATHAAIQFGQEWPDLLAPWYTDSNFLVIVGAPDEDALMQMADYANELGIRYSIVEEPDLHDSVTAIALQPGEVARMLCACSPLALREAEEPEIEYATP